MPSLPQPKNLCPEAVHCGRQAQFDAATGTSKTVLRLGLSQGGPSRQSDCLFGLRLGLDEDGSRKNERPHGQGERDLRRGFQRPFVNKCEVRGCSMTGDQRSSVRSEIPSARATRAEPLPEATFYG